MDIYSKLLRIICEDQASCFSDILIHLLAKLALVFIFLLVLSLYITSNLHTMSDDTPLTLEAREAALLRREAELDAREAALVEREAALNQSSSTITIDEEPPSVKEQVLQAGELFQSLKLLS
jgi:hypothetical protein